MSTKINKYYNFKNSLVFKLLKVIFSIYLVITVLITIIQMKNEYYREMQAVKNSLEITQEIFNANLTEALWTFNDKQLAASLAGILKVSTIVGVEILNTDPPPSWKDNISLRLGMILNSKGQIIDTSTNNQVLKNSFYLNLISHSFKLQRNDIFLGEVVFYSSNEVIFNKIKHIFLNILIAAIIKTLILWTLFILAFYKFLREPLENFCQKIEKVDIDNPATTFIKLEQTNIYEFQRLENIHNSMLKKILETKQKLDEWNKTLEQEVEKRTIEISNQNRQLELLNQEKNEFLSIAAHDLRNPLSVISSSSELIEKILKENLNQENLFKYLDFISESSNKMSLLINNLLDVNKIELYQTSVHFVKTELLIIIKDLIKLNQKHAKEKDIVIQLKAAGDSYYVLSDKIILSQILDNLISNAIKYSPIHAKVEISLLKKDNKIRFEIKDYGEGLTDDEQQKLFMKFSRLSSKPTANENSIGLGLYIAQKLAQMLNTKIECKSVKHQGSIFSLNIPVLDNGLK